MLRPCLAFLLPVLCFFVTDAATAAPEPYLLQRSILDPGTSPQISASQGFSVAVDAGRAVVGAPTDDLGGTDSGVVKVYDPATGALLHLLLNPSPNPSDQFGWSVAISGSRVIVGARFDDTSAANAGIAFVYELAGATPTVPIITLTNPSPASGDQFGYAVAISGTRVVVGTPFDDAGTNDAGSAYVFDLASPTPNVPIATLTNPVPTFAGGFGISAALFGTTVVIGANGEDTGADNAGSAYVYDLNSATPDVPVFTLNNPSPGTNDQFGISVAVSGTRVVVGAWLDDTGTTNAGSAYVYDLAGPTPTVPSFTLNNPAPAVSDDFGRSVAISGTHVIVGAFQDDTAGIATGSAYIYDLGGHTATNPVYTLTKPNPAVSGQFGWAVAISGTRAIVTNPSDNISAGLAYSYDLAGATPTVAEAILNFPSPATADYFGIASAIAGNLLVVGATGDDTGFNNAGRAYVYNLDDLENGLASTPLAELNNPAPAANDNFGFAVGISGTRVVVGASGDDFGATNSGSAYVYELSGGAPPLLIATLNNPSPAIADNFGEAVAISGTRIIIGASLDNAAGSDTGTAYLYDLASPTPTTPLLTMINPTPASLDYFGASVSIAGNWVVIGAYGDDAGAANAGRAYVYNLTNATPEVPVFTLNNPSPSLDYGFGFSVAISGNRVVIGNNSRRTAYVYDLASLTPALPMTGLTGGVRVAISGTRVVVADALAAYVYDLTNAVPGVPVATLTNSGGATDDQFGSSVAIEGTRVAIGAPYRDTTVADRGAVHIYAPWPRLSFTAGAPGQAIINWVPTLAPGFVLQHTEDLAQKNWVNTTSGSIHPTTVTITNSLRFYRLRHP